MEKEAKKKEEKGRKRKKKKTRTKTKTKKEKKIKIPPFAPEEFPSFGPGSSGSGQVLRPFFFECVSVCVLFSIFFLFSRRFTAFFSCFSFFLAEIYWILCADLPGAFFFFLGGFAVGRTAADEIKTAMKKKQQQNKTRNTAGEINRRPFRAPARNAFFFCL